MCVCGVVRLGSVSDVCVCVCVVLLDWDQRCHRSFDTSANLSSTHRDMQEWHSRLTLSLAM